MATEYKLSYTASEIDSKLGQIDNAVLYTTQALTDEQKSQARENIKALGVANVEIYNEVVGGGSTATDGASYVYKDTLVISIKDEDGSEIEGGKITATDLYKRALVDGYTGEEWRFYKDVAAAVQGAWGRVLIDGVDFDTDDNKLYLTSGGERVPSMSVIIPTTSGESGEDGADKSTFVQISDTEPTDAATEIWINTSEDWNDNIADSMVLYTTQALTNEQKEQVRENIGAASLEQINQLSSEKVDRADMETYINETFLGGAW